MAIATADPNRRPDDARVATDYVSPSALTPSATREMFRLLEHYYKDVDYERFVADLAEKETVFRFTSWRGGRAQLVGFSTIMRRKMVRADGREVTVLFSGDTVMQRELWGSKVLQMAFFWYITRAKLSAPFKPLYWMLISKGYKTFLMMRRNFGHSFPNSTGATPPQLQALMDRFYSDKYGGAYDAASGLIVFPESHGAVKDQVAAPNAHALTAPDVRFFLERNPRYERGEEMACIAEIRLTDFPLHIVKYFLPRGRLKLAPQQAPAADAIARG